MPLVDNISVTFKTIGSFTIAANILTAICDFEDNSRRESSHLHKLIPKKQGNY